MPRRRFVLAVQLVDVDGAFFVHIDDRDVAIGAQADRAFLRIDLPNFGRVLRRDFDVLVQREPAFVHFGQDQRHASFDAAESRNAIPDRGLGELAINIRALLVQSVRRVIGRQCIDETFA